MKPPEKKKITHPCCQTGTCIQCAEEVSRNQTIDDMHKWIDEAPIEEVFYEIDYCDSVYTTPELVNMVRKLLKGEK